MKFFILLMTCVFSAFSSFSQSKWFVSFSSGYGFGGPMSSIKKQMGKDNFTQKSPSVTIGGLEFGSVQYPILSRGIPGLVKVGIKVKENRSLYFEAGTSSNGEITGYRFTGYDPSGAGLSNRGNKINIAFSVLQFTAGYQYSFPSTRSKFGIGPSLFIFKYEETYQDKEKHSSIVPGASLMARLPLGKEKRLIGIDVVGEANIAPPATMKAMQQVGNPSVPTSITTLRESKVSMMQGMLGLALSIRSKKQ